MSNAFILNKDLGRLDLIDALDERIGKIKALTASLLLANNGDSGLSNETTSGLVWAINDFVAEVEELLGAM